MSREFTAHEWSEQLDSFRRVVNANDDDLRSFTLGAIRSLARDGDLDGIRAALEGLDDALGLITEDPRPRKPVRPNPHQ